MAMKFILCELKLCLEREEGSNAVEVLLIDCVDVVMAEYMYASKDF